MAGEATRRFVHQTDHVRADRSRPDVVEFRRMDPSNRPAPFKRYPLLEPRLLPDDLSDALGRLLFLSAGVTRAAEGAMGPTWFRATPAAGNLHPNELYVVCGDLPGVEAGVHHYAPLEHALTALRRGDYRNELAEAAVIGRGSEATALVVITGMPWRTGWKYGDRGLRHLYWDAGAILGNLLAVADDAAQPAHVFAGFDDDRVASLLGLDPEREYPLAVVAVGAPEGPPSARVVAAGSGVNAIDLTVEALSPEPRHFPLAEATQREGDLSDAEDVKGWRHAAATARRPRPAAPAVPEPGDAIERSAETVILRRGSTRLFRREQAPRSLLEWGVGDACRPLPFDAAPPGGSLLDVYLTVHAIEGVDPGAYRWQPTTAHHVGSFEQLLALSEDDARAAGAHLCLDQPLGGDSAFTAFLCSDLDEVLERLGDRGYRAALLEAGVVAGRLQLNAFALGFGGTGLTFWDEEVAAWFGTTATPMLVAAIGVPATHPAPSGRPRQPAVLGGYGPLMDRMTNELFRRR